MRVNRFSKWSAILACCALILGAGETPNRSVEEAPFEEVDQLARFEKLWSACSPGDIGDWIDVADWARAVGLSDKAEELYRLVLDHDPINEEAYEAVVELAARRPPTRLSRAYEEARAVLPARFVAHETRRFIAFSDADARWTHTQVRRLERTHHQFGRFAAKLKLRPLPQRHKLVCVLFSDRDEYQQFARTEDEVANPWIAGYYSPAHDRIVFYQGDANPSVVEAREKLDRMQAEIDTLEDEHHRAIRQGNLQQAETLRQQRDRSQEHVDQERDRVDAFAEQINIATTVHEATHQLLFHTRVQSPHVRYPVWISEGLATAFETDAPDTPFGPDRDYAPRRESFDELLREDGLIPLEKLVSWSSVPSDHQRIVHAVYHQSYALVTWMSRFRRDELRRFLARMRLEDADAPDAARYVELFEEAFGDVTRLERAWLRYERSRLDD